MSEIVWKRTVDETPDPYETLLGCDIIMAYGEVYTTFTYDPVRGFSVDHGHTWEPMPPYYWAEIPQPPTLHHDYYEYDDKWDNYWRIKYEPHQ
jgi:hypothetical protein